MLFLLGQIDVLKNIALQSRELQLLNLLARARWRYDTSASWANTRQRGIALDGSAPIASWRALLLGSLLTGA